MQFVCIHSDTCHVRNIIALIPFSCFSLNVGLHLVICIYGTANLKYHANPILVMDVDRLFASASDEWAYVPDDACSPYIRANMGLFNNYAYVVVSKETVPSFVFLGKKVNQKKTTIVPHMSKLL